MKLFITSYIEELLKKANYEYDKATKSWCASVDELPGAYAQADTVEEVRGQLAEVIEDYILVSLTEGQKLPHFKKFTKNLQYAKSN
ncbi:type II toxin-antitoxin system HicB family antitoxin [Patescibacteria group bacterium AH-259-L07]|nr:type II toxin-antitoxin system HicB family antitoxin [Patescibacteria group bacterium AH-259-L07]